jgi:hypothetical protein
MSDDEIKVEAVSNNSWHVQGCEAPHAVGTPCMVPDGLPTGIRINQNCESWGATGHGGMSRNKPCKHKLAGNPDVENVTIRLRRIGWIDQRGRVYVKCPPMQEFDGGSLTPLLINPGCD